MTDERVQEIVVYLKENLGIDWNDDDKLLTRKIKTSMAYFDRKTGVSLTYEDNSAELELTLERARYDWNNALDDFENNYKSEILSLIMDVALSQEPKEDDADGTN